MWWHMALGRLSSTVGVAEQPGLATKRNPVLKNKRKQRREKVKMENWERQKGKKRKSAAFRYRVRVERKRPPEQRGAEGVLWEPSPGKVSSVSCGLPLLAAYG